MRQIVRDRIPLILVFCFSLLMITGCRGCRDDSEKTVEEKKREEEEKKEREKPNFETEAAVVYPGQYSDSTLRNRTKRGHWVSTDFRITANKFDAQGDLTATSFATNAPVTVESTDYVATTSRPFSIAKGEKRNLETSVYLPRRDGGVNQSINFNLSRNSGSLMQFNDIHVAKLMRAHQFHMVVLTNRADSYSYLNVIDSVKIPEFESGFSPPSFYTVVRTRPSEEPIALPRESL
ncbi:MAG: hypothetical protein AAGA30_00730, partial [Planctomycetota bacterium]